MLVTFRVLNFSVLVALHEYSILGFLLLYISTPL